MRKALIVGGSGSVGAELVRAWARREDVEVTFTYGQTVDVALALEKESGAKALRVDLNSADCAELVSPEYDVLVNAGGIIRAKNEIPGVPLQDVLETLQINAVAPFLLCAKLLPYMAESGWGRIVNVGSIWAERGTDANVAYNMSKHALLGLTKSIAKEFGGRGVLCNQVDPGAIDSRVMRNFAEEAVDAGNANSTEGFLKSVAERNPIGRLVQPADVVSVIDWLVFDNSFVNGVAVPVDGGLIA